MWYNVITFSTCKTIRYKNIKKYINIFKKAANHGKGVSNYKMLTKNHCKWGIGKLF